MPMFEVVLEAVVDDSPAFTTADVVEAADAAAAEAQAIEAWELVEPRFTFWPLVTRQVDANKT
jgi:hypothetical protein